MVPTDAGVELGVGNQCSGIAKSVSNACPMAKRVSMVGKSSPSGCHKHGPRCAVKTKS